jgi:hypothetical protein
VYNIPCQLAAPAARKAGRTDEVWRTLDALQMLLTPQKCNKVTMRKIAEVPELLSKFPFNFYHPAHHLLFLRIR